MENLEDKKKEFFDNCKIESMDYNRVVEANEILNAALATYGLMKGQHVAGHERMDPRTGLKFKAGQGGTGSPKKVLGEGKTVAPRGTMSKLGDRIGEGSAADLMNIADIVPKSDIDNPDMLETIIRNLELATVDEIETMANEMFFMQESRTKGRLAELILKEVLRRGLVEKNSLEKQMEETKKSADTGAGWDR